MKKMMLFILLCGLSACLSPEERAAREEAREAAIEQKKEQYCANIGAPLGSDRYYDCRKWIEQELAAEIAQQNQATIAALAYSVPQQQQSQPQFIMPVPNLMNPTTNCVTTPIGNQLHTRCQ